MDHLNHFKMAAIKIMFDSTILRFHDYATKKQLLVSWSKQPIKRKFASIKSAASRHLYINMLDWTVIPQFCVNRYFESKLFWDKLV